MKPTAHPHAAARPLAARPFASLTGVAVPMLRVNIDTDAIIPSREIKSVGKQGLASGLFAGWRYLEPGSRTPNSDFVLNDVRYVGAQILLTGCNFGCGSSREHAVWALLEYGIRAIFAPSFAPIFQGNCLRNGVLAGTLSEPAIAQLAATIAEAPQTRQVRVDLEHRRLTLGTELSFDFEIDADSRATLLSGLDAIDVTLSARDAIESFRRADRLRRPWVYLAPST